MVELDNSQAQVNMVTTNSFINRQTQSYVPFLMKSNRFKQLKNISPPIGSYNIQSCFAKKSSPLQNKISHFILQAQKGKQQMSVFKSTKNRFENINNCVPSPTFYNLFNKAELTKERKFKKYQDRQHLNLSHNNKMCPSIPNKESKYGYSIVNHRQHEKIQKTFDQIQKQKVDRKNYLSGFRSQSQGSSKFQTFYRQNYQKNLKKKIMYQNSLKLIGKDLQLQEQKSQLGSNLNKKPKYQHLYHSKGVPLSKNHLLLGPGQYDIYKNQPKNAQKALRFQFFGSTQVRFPQKNTNQQKGYTLLQMIKENKRQQKAQLGNSIRQPFSESYRKGFQSYNQNNPGPGNYDPDDICLKKARGTAVFSQQKRFKQNKNLYETHSNFQQSKKNRSSKQSNIGNLKRQKKRNIHKSSLTSSCDQIYGVVSHGIQNSDKQKYEKIYKDLGKISENQDISCWNYDEKDAKNDNIKYLNNQLAFISSPREEQAIPRTDD